MERFFRMNHSSFMINHIKSTSSQSIYTIKNVDKAIWPLEQILIDACDHLNLGGKVEICSNENAIVTVYTD